jgi:hypothetical protein
MNIGKQSINIISSDGHVHRWYFLDRVYPCFMCASAWATALCIFLGFLYLLIVEDGKQVKFSRIHNKILISRS